MNNIQNLIELTTDIQALLRTIAMAQMPEAEQLLRDKVSQLASLVLEPQAPTATSEAKTVESETPLIIEEKTEKSAPADFAKSFTINDRYRYIQMLFNGNREKFESTLALVSSMKSLDEAYDYFLNELNWDVDDKQEASEFLMLVAHHFNAIG